MAMDGNVTGIYKGPRRYTGQCQFDQTITGIIGVPGTGKIYYVDKNKTSGATGDGTSWLAAFLTVTEGLAALGDYDVLIIAPGNYDEAAKMTLTGVKGVKIYGYANGMQWGEGSTCIRNVTSGTDILDITGCQALEINGISFIVTSADEDAINFTGLNYSVEIANCGFIGDVGGGTVMAYGINADGSNGPDLYVHDCRFFRVKTAGIVMGNQRNVISDNVFIIPASGKGIILSGAAAAGYNVIKDCDFLGANSSDVGIYTATSVIGNWIASNCQFAATAEAIQDAGAADSDQNVVLCRRDDAGLGGIAGADPEA